MNPKRADEVRFINVAGSRVRIATRLYTVQQPPILLINGIGARLELWRPFSLELPDRALLMFDLPGISGFPAHDLPLGMPGLARWLIELMDSVGVEQVDLLGYSWGGLLAQQLARDAPQRIRALILASTNFGIGTEPPLGIMPLPNLLPNDRGDDPWKLLSAVLGGPTGQRNPIGTIMTALNALTTPIEGNQRQLYALTGWTSLPWLHKLQLPTLVIAGDDDPYVPKSAVERLARSLPRARLELVAGAGHLLPINRPGPMAYLVDDFLRQFDA